MSSLLRLGFLLPLVAGSLLADIDRTLTRTFQVAPADSVVVDVSNGSITVEVVEGDQVTVELRQRINASTEAAADEIMQHYELVADYGAGEVTLRAKRPKSSGWISASWGRSDVRFSTRVTVPSTVSLDLDTSGGKIQVKGLVSGALRADTSGGSIAVTGGRGDINLDTSGGSIRVDQAFGNVRADTSGGSIKIGYVGPTATDINADTSGGSITIGVDPTGNWDLNADTSGGGVHLDGLNLANAQLERSSARGRINAGGHRLRADTSGGSINIRAARAPGAGE